MCRNLQDAHCNLQQPHSGQTTTCTTNTLQRAPYTTGTLIVHKLAGCALHQRHLPQLASSRMHPAPVASCNLHPGPTTLGTGGTLQRATYINGTVHVLELAGCALHLCPLPPLPSSRVHPTTPRSPRTSDTLHIRELASCALQPTPPTLGTGDSLHHRHLAAWTLHHRHPTYA